MLSSDVVDAYSIAVLGGAPYLHLASYSPQTWLLVFILFTVPALVLLINLGYVSGVGHVSTFNRIAPIASGVGWALTWLAGERLYMQSLIAAQYVLYIIYSMRTRLDWALECGHIFNNELCRDFLRDNISHGLAQHEPDNNWPAQQFNRYGIRGVPLISNISLWVPNAWYFGEPNTTIKFSIEFPAVSLTLAHFIVWILIFAIVYQYSMNPGWFLARFCFLLPVAIHIILVFGLSIFGFSFKGDVEREITPVMVEKYPFVFFSDLHGIFRSTIAQMDYSSAFTGLIIFASSRVRPGNLPMNVFVLFALQFLIPLLHYVIRIGCGGHLANIQPAYESYIGSDGTFSFDLAATCFATTSGGPLWAVLFYSANLLFTCIGPMVILLLFIYNAFLEQFPFVERFSTFLLTLLCFVFAANGVILCMPLGTSLETLLQFVSQSSIIQIFVFIIIMFVYGWHNLERDVRLLLGSVDHLSLLSYLTGPVSPLFTILLLLSVPALLAAKFASVFDLLLGGMDIQKHIDYGTSFISSSLFLNRAFGYGILLAPSIIIIIFAIAHIYRNVFIFKMPIGSVLDSTADWKTHLSVRNTNVTRFPPISHRIYNSFTQLPYRTTLFIILIAEIVFGIVLAILFFSNAFYSRIHSDENTSNANNYRTLLLLIFLTFHVFSLLEIRWTLQKWDHSSRLNLYIAVASMETAFLNGYMWMFSVDHTWGLLFTPLIVLIVNTAVRGIMIAIVIAVRWSMSEMSHPTRTRDATEIYDATADLDHDLDREDDAPIIYEMRGDIFA